MSGDRSANNAGFRRTRRTLADGRAIRYYDAVATARTAVDTRDLPPATTHSQTRFDPLLGEWVVVASHRQTRTFLPPADLCPLCPSTPERPTEIPESDYEVAVFDNRFPSLSTHPDQLPQTVEGSPMTLLDNGFGHCEVVCFTSDHNSSFANLDPARARLVVDVWADRTAELAAADGVAQVYCFENHGEEIGVTLSHPHGQIYAYPFVAPRTEAITRNLTEYRKAHGSNLFGDLLTSERSAGIRVVAENSEWTAFVPPFARWPYELMLLPRRRTADICDLDDAQRAAFAELYLNVLGRFARRFDTPMPYIAAWNQPPTPRTGLPREDWWLNLHLFSFRRSGNKLKYLAGSESGMGVFISDTLPETVAAELRELA
ncbi:galactose-1-phosphate uridylyltransferase [Nocardia panacis]|uniref:Galactose-1-phosphate uridylyltransferase n=1 Tax=Nocardia panacis TaxID=2340916 RepID=A0A3A4JSE7_9NOCA|nr:galactose-1-phosphate uridylyltransferase [Nocardia panacis]RJO72574.1 galactose-1-phosphate uridylyltransferase [Nocardia panacis]